MNARGFALLLAGLAGLANAQVQVQQQSVTLSCAVAYLPARSTWVREVQIDWDHAAIRALRIDGLTPYSFSLQQDRLLTAIDNERIEIDLRMRVWTSDFRGLATGQGRCETEAS